MSFDWVIGLSGSILVFLKNQNEVILIKKKQKLTGYNRVFDRVLPGHVGRRVTSGFDFFYFFLNPARFQPRILSRPAKPGRVSKLWFEIFYEEKCQTPLSWDDDAGKRKLLGLELVQMIIDKIQIIRSWMKRVQGI